MRKERVLAILIAAVVVLFGCLYMSSIVGASDGIPEGVTRFYDCGNVCYVWPDGSGDCYPCRQDPCESERQPTLTPTDEPQPTPTDEPTPPPPPQPTPEEKEKCNSGRGNDSEGDPDCDPGNSGGKNQGGD